MGCGRPYNPDRFMLRCSKCDKLFHPECLQIPVSEFTEHSPIGRRCPRPACSVLASQGCCKGIFSTMMPTSIGRVPSRSISPQMAPHECCIELQQCTVRVIIPVHSEMRYCNHRDQCPWRCFTARQDNKHTLVGLSRPPRKANVAPGKCRSTEQFSQTISAVKTGVQVESMLVRKRLRHRYPALTMVCAKTGQLSTVVSSFDSKAMA